jgi:HlyD family secretion protein
LTSLKVQRGVCVKAGQPLFDLEKESELAAQREAADRMREATARLENLKKGQRPSEIASLQARLANVQASLKLSEAEYQRRDRLLKEKVIAVEEFDQARSTFERDQAQVKELAANLETAQLGGRIDEIKAAEADVAASQATLAQIDWKVNQKSQAAPADALVQDTLYRQGEWVPAGSPIVSLLPPSNIKVRFFVSETRVAALQMGQEVTVHVDGVASAYRAKVNYISTQAEFTPPVIYSKENRAKLVFMVEAVFDIADAANLRPGQPVDVRLK